MIALSFSGGKDSCLALYELQQQGWEIGCLFTTVWKENGKTIAHEDSLEALKEQAERLRLPIHFIYTSMEEYETDFIRTLSGLKDMYDLRAVAFGDWYLKGHIMWGVEQAEKVGLDALYPLRAPQSEMLKQLRRFVRLGFIAKVIKIDDKKLPADWVGRIIDEQFVADIQAYDVCPMGENGEYHTRVLDGPIFHK